jgi:hypothetical protein
MRPLLIAVVAAMVSTGAAALAAPGTRTAAPCGNPTIVRTVTLKIPGGTASFSGFAAGKTYLVRFSGSIAIDGSQLGLADAPGAFRVDNLANDVLLSSFPASRLAVAGVPGAYQLAVQRDPSGNALRYGAPAASRTCPVLPASRALPGSSLQLAAATLPWSGSVRVDVLVYGGSATPGPGKTYAVAETGIGTFATRESSKYLFSWQGSSYRATGVQFKLSAQVSEQLGSKNKTPKLLSGAAKVAMYLARVKGSSAAKITQPLNFNLTGIQDLDVSPTGQAFDFRGTVIGAAPPPCKNLDLYTDPTSGTLDFHVCNMEGQGTATATITPRS